MKGVVVDVVDGVQLDKLIAGNGSFCVVHFYADWAKPCAALNKVLDELSKKHSNGIFGRVEAEQCASVAEKFSITVVPTFVFWKGGAIVQRIEGAKTTELTQAVAKFAAGSSESQAAAPSAHSASSDPEEQKARLLRLVNHAPVMLFMKAVEVLNSTGARFSSFNILEHADVRAGLKTLFNWPTFPQLYIKGNLVGGLDVMKELDSEGELKKMIPPEAFAPAQSLNPADNLEALVNRSPVMLFMKGAPDQPSCGFSNQMVQLLRNQGVLFDSFDILSNPAVREGLKAYSNWPTFPQLYVKGKLLGGLDVTKELAEEGELLALIPESHRKKN